ncbi:3-hydroxyacyl-CoA dehydrogenase family protein [Actinomadura keratinilytica]
MTRTVRLLGVTDALLKLLLQGTQYSPRRALDNGLVHAVAETPEQMLVDARAFIDAHPESVQPWDVKGYRIPGGTPAHPKFAANLPAFPANLKKQTSGAPYPAPRNILAAAVEGSQVDFETAQVIEARYFTELVTGQIAKNMIQAFFFDLQAVNSGANRPKDVERSTVRKVAVLGAGMMGAGIAYSCARAGIEVLLKDVTPEAAAKGKAYSEKLCDKAVSRGRTTREKADQVLARITPTAEVADLAGCDAVIEAVFEDTSLKHKVFQEIQDVVAPDALLCSNTSTLPITALAEGVKRQEDFIGLHFFSPVDKMPLVEIIKGERTGDVALARAFDLVRQIKKTPIVVNDSRGFFTSRVIGHFINEGVAMVGEGLDPVSVEQAAAQAGYPAKVLSLIDELTLTLPRKIRNETKKAIEEAAAPGPTTPPTRWWTAWSTSSAAPAVAAAPLLRLRRGRLPRRALAGPARALHPARHHHPVQGHAGADALLGGAGHRPPRRGRRPHLGRRRQHRLHHGHRLPRLDRRHPPVHQRLRGRPARLRGPRRGTGRHLRRAVHAPALLVAKAEKGERFTD